MCVPDKRCQHKSSRFVHGGARQLHIQNYALAAAMDMPDLSRTAIVQCVALDSPEDDSSIFKVATSLSVKVYGWSNSSRFLQTVCRETHRHAATWQDDANWIPVCGGWKRICEHDDNRVPLLEVFRLVQQFCQSGVCHQDCRAATCCKRLPESPAAFPVQS